MGWDGMRWRGIWWNGMELGCDGWGGMRLGRMGWDDQRWGVARRDAHGGCAPDAPVESDCLPITVCHIPSLPVCHTIPSHLTHAPTHASRPIPVPHIVSHPIPPITLHHCHYHPITSHTRTHPRIQALPISLTSLPIPSHPTPPSSHCHYAAPSHHIPHTHLDIQAWQCRKGLAGSIDRSAGEGHNAVVETTSALLTSSGLP